MILVIKLAQIGGLLLDFLGSLQDKILKLEWYWWVNAQLLLIVCTVYSAIKNPSGAINLFMNKCIDIIASPLPSTPNQYKLGTLLDNFFYTYPAVGNAATFEILQGVLGILTIYLAVKLYKFLPFT